jgi:hypothetical protein
LNSDRGGENAARSYEPITHEARQPSLLPFFGAGDYGLQSRHGPPRLTIKSGMPPLMLSISALRLFFTSVMLAFLIEPK